MRTLTVVAALAVMLGSGAPARAQELRYSGKVADGTNRGRVHWQGEDYSVREGDDIPGWGRVKAVTEEALVVSRRLTDAEKQAREAEGLLVVDIQEVRVPNSAPKLARDVKR